MEIYGKLIKLRALEISDMEILRQIINDPEVEYWVGGWSFPVSKKEQEEWYNSIYNDKRNLRFAIETKKDGVIGMANLSGIDWKNRTAEVGIKLGNKNYRAKGYGTDTIMAIMSYAFSELGLNKLECKILNYNIASQKLFVEKCGWIIEGEKREQIYKGDKYHNQLVLGILNREYQELITKKKYWDEDNDRNW